MIRRNGYGAVLLLTAVLTLPLGAQNLSFLRQIPNSQVSELATSVVAEVASLYMTGNRVVRGVGGEGFVRRYDATGRAVWDRRLDASPRDLAFSGTSLYVTGSTDALPGQRNVGALDIFVRKYDATGNELWTRQFGTPLTDFANGVAADATGVYVAASMGQWQNASAEALVRKYDSEGNELWARQFGMSSFAQGIAVDAGGVYVAGLAVEELQAKESFVRKYDAAGKELWTRWFGAHTIDPPGVTVILESVTGLSTDGSGIYVVSAGSHPALRKFDAAGSESWTRPLRPDRFLAPRVRADATGVYVAGNVDGALPGQCSAGLTDAFVKKYDSSGHELWTRQFGSFGVDSVVGLALDSSGVYVGGTRAVSVNLNGFVARLEKATAAAVDSGPRILWECVVNAASYEGGGVSPGEIVTIFGAAIGPVQPEGALLNEDRRLGTMVGNTRVLFNGIPAPLLYASDKQSTAIVPYDVAGESTVAVEVEHKGVRSPIVTVPVLGTRPGLFSVDGSGRGQAVAFNEDGSVNSPSNPAKPGSIVVFYATGEGLIDPPVPDGLIVSGVLPKPRLPVSVRFLHSEWDYTQRGEVLYAGSVSGSVAGLLQINVRLPADMPAALWHPHLQIGVEDPDTGNLLEWGYRAVTIAVEQH